MPELEAQETEKEESKKEIPELKKESWREKLERNWFQTRLAHEGMMIGKLREQNKIVQDNIKNMAGIKSSDDEMGDVNIGNETHNHYDSTTTSGVPAPKAPESPSGLSPLAKGLLGAALLAGGAGAGYMFAGGATNTDTDTNTTYQYDAGLGTPPQGDE